MSAAQFQETDAEDQSFSLNAIGQVAIPVANVDEARHFYQHVLGIRFLFTAPPGLAFFDCGGIRLMLDGSGEQSLEHRASTVYYKVSDLHAAVERLRERGAVFVAEPHRIATMTDHELWMAFLRDPSDNLIGLMCERPLSTGG